MILSPLGIPSIAANETARADSAKSAETLYESLEADSKIFDYVSKDDFQRAGHIQRLEAMETLSSYVFLNPNGSSTAYILEENVKFRDASGKMKEKDLSLRTTFLGDYQTTANDVGLTLPARIQSGVTLTSGNIRLCMIPLGVKTFAAAEYTEADGTITYRDVFGSGTALRYIPTLSGVKEDIVLQRYTGQTSFAFSLDAGELHAYQDEGGCWYFAAAPDAAERITFDAIQIFDANGNFALGEMTVSQIQNGYKLTVTAPEAFLLSANYPVSIDPSLYIRDGGTGNNIQDAAIYQNMPTTNTGTWQFISAGHVTDSSFDYGIGRIFVKLPGLYNSGCYNLPMTRVEYYIKDASGAYSSSTVSAYANVATGTYKSWTETNVTWNRSTATDYSTVEATSSVPAAGWACFNITGLVQKWKNGTCDAELGLTLRNSNETDAAYKKSFLSNNNTAADNRPHVKIVFADKILTPGLYQIQSTGSQLYLDVYGMGMTSGTDICDWYENKNSNQIWFLDYQSNGYYKLHPMHVPAMVIGYNTSSGRCTVMADSTADGTFKLVSKYQYSTSPKYLTNTDDNYTVCGTYSSTDSNWIIKEFINDTYWDGGYTFAPDGHIDAAYTITSAATALIPESVIREAVERWNGISSHVNLTYVPYSQKDACGKPIIFTINAAIFVSDTANQDVITSVCGICFPKANQALAGESDNWDISEVMLNKAYFQTHTLSDAQIKAIISHEVGHALKLSHCRETDPDLNSNRQPEYKASYPSLMQTEFNRNTNGVNYDSALSGIISWELTEFDKAALIAKWGR